MKTMISAILASTALLFSSVVVADSVNIRFVYENRIISDTPAEKELNVRMSESGVFEFRDSVRLEGPDAKDFVEVFLSGTIRLLESHSAVSEPKPVYQIIYQFGSADHSVLATIPEKSAGMDSDETTVILSQISNVSTFYGADNGKDREMKESYTVMLSDAGL